MASNTEETPTLVTDHAEEPPTLVTDHAEELPTLATDHAEEPPTLVPDNEEDPPTEASDHRQEPPTAVTDHSSLSTTKKINLIETFCRSDPRRGIMRNFQRLTSREMLSDPSSPFVENGKADLGPSTFSVWRPTSFEAIRKMMLKEGTGKGLDVKGKSAKRGALSGFVPYVQIHNNDKDKAKVGTCPRDARVSIFFKTRDLRDLATTKLEEVLNIMVVGLAQAEKLLSIENHSEEEREEALKRMMWKMDREEALERMMWKMDDPKIRKIDQYDPNCFGIDIPERLFWEAYIVQGKCVREEGSDMDTGRESMPDFFNLNMKSTRDNSKDPNAVVWQWRKNPGSDPMDPMTLVVAYEENNHVIPVVSDFDPFLIGTRGVDFYKKLEREQVELMKWSINEIHKLLKQKGNGNSWTEIWLRVLEKASDRGYKPPTMPQYGYGDPVSISMIESTVKYVQSTGAVRHGAESFNYYFPQDLDEEFLVIFPEHFSKPYKIMKPDELQDFLLEQIKMGFTFPLNPKWILCDKGWVDVWRALRSSTHDHVRDSLNVWFPPESGVVEQMDDIVQAYPDGLEFSLDDLLPLDSSLDLERLDTRRRETSVANYKISEAMLRLERRDTFNRAKKKLLSILRLVRHLKNDTVSNINDIKQVGADTMTENKKWLDKHTSFHSLGNEKRTSLSDHREFVRKQDELQKIEKEIEEKNLELSQKESRLKSLDEKIKAKSKELSAIDEAILLEVDSVSLKKTGFWDLSCFKRIKSPSERRNHREMDEYLLGIDNNN